MCYITATEFKKNLGHYMELSKTEDVIVTKNNNVITILTNKDNYKLLLIERSKGMFGKVDKDIDYDKLINEEISKRCGF